MGDDRLRLGVALGRAHGGPQRDARCLLIDDVKTTGATLEECAKVLRGAGAAEVYAAVLVKVEFEPGTPMLPRTI